LASPFNLTARADRIDLLKDGTARIIDFKSGGIPSWEQVASGLNPQLTLEAAIHEANGFAFETGGSTSQIGYIKLSGGDVPGEYKVPNPKAHDIAQLVRTHFEGVHRLVRAFDDVNTPYIPRGRVDKGDKNLDYDHLSRFREWAQGGDGG
jgi:ATP-dependent helicase/nuclease subunit B